MSLYWKTSMASRRLMGFKRLLSRLLYVIRSVHSAHLINRHEHDSQNVDKLDTALRAFMQQRLIVVRLT